MEEAGIITGYRAEVNPAKVGLPITAFMRLNTPTTQYPRVLALIRSLPQVLECHHVAGGDSFIMKVVVASIPELEELIAQFSPYGQTTTSIVLSSPIIKPAIEPPLTDK